ncbi:MAG: hypothetical protein M0P39_11685 [Rhodocyclaceae bacterium]|nr:hypothetical protein [Rhodocyclaceae bacterium]
MWTINLKETLIKYPTVRALKGTRPCGTNGLVQSFLDRKQRGFSIPAAIFIIVILAALGAFLATVGGTQQLGHAQDIVGVRALQAARSGVDWGVHQVINTGTYRTGCDGGSASATLPALANMDGLTVVVGCTSSAYSEGASTLHSYQITATACNNPTCPNTAAGLPNLYVERRVVTLVTN